MSVRDFLLVAFCCFVWGLNLVVTRWVSGINEVPPLFYSAARFALIAALLIPWLRHRPQNIGIVFAAAMLGGALNFSFLFIGLSVSPASTASIVGQLGLPFTTILSVIFLGERVRWRRGLGMLLAFVGVMVVSLKPGELSFSLGLLWIVASALAGSSAGILMKRMPPMDALTLMAWTALFSTPPLIGATALLETGQIAAAAGMGWQFWACLAFSAIIVSIISHSIFYELIKRHEMTLLSPLTLMTPLWSVTFGLLALNEHPSPQLFVGGAIALAGVAMIAIRPNLSLSALQILRGRSGA
jgi:O-acetylserine/cysteine efflux transporter